MSDGPNTIMNEELRKLLEDVKRYIERMEVQIDGEWGSCREVEELQEQDLMPELYARVNAALANDQRNGAAENGPPQE
jgi:hypothetical protein